MPKYELHKVGFVNPNDLTETLVLSTILEGAERATRAFAEDAAEGFITEDNQLVEDTLTPVFTMAGLPKAGASQLSTWADAGTKLSIIGFSYDDLLQIDNAFIRSREVGGERLAWGVEAKKAGGVGYNSGGKKHDEFMISPNGFNMYKWVEGETNMPAAWTKTGGSSTWSAGAITFSTTGATPVNIEREIFFPFQKQVTFRIEATSTVIATGMSMEILALDENGSTIGSPATQTIQGLGVESVTRTLPAGTVSARCRARIGQGDSITFKDPAFNLGTSTQYISQ